MKIVPTCIDTRAVKVKIEKIDIPVGYAAAFEGERVRKDDMHVQFGFKYSDGLEYAYMVDPAARSRTAEVKLRRARHRLGRGGRGHAAGHRGAGFGAQDADRLRGHPRTPGPPLVVQRHGLHAHRPARTRLWCRISKKSFDAGFRLEHLGTILHAKIHDEYGGIVDKVAVRHPRPMPDKVKAKKKEAAREAASTVRDDRIAGMTDESVDTVLQLHRLPELRPDHVCVITPQRLGLCGAYNWLDGRANYEINPTGPNQPIAKGRTIDHQKGEWEGVNKFVYENSEPQGRAVLCVQPDWNRPMTSCGCFECIVAILPLANGVMVVNREFTTGDAPPQA